MRSTRGWAKSWQEGGVNSAKRVNDPPVRGELVRAEEAVSCYLKRRIQLYGRATGAIIEEADSSHSKRGADVWTRGALHWAQEANVSLTKSPPVPALRAAPDAGQERIHAHFKSGRKSNERGGEEELEEVR